MTSILGCSKISTTATTSTLTTKTSKVAPKRTLLGLLLIKQSTLEKRRRRKKFLKPFRKECAQIAVEVHRDVTVEWIVEHMTRFDEERQKALEAKIAFIRNA